jgi:GT2 family glycosyltransferase
VPLAAPERVVAVIVAWNRRELMLEGLRALAAQTRPVDAVVVIDNASTDGSADAARELMPGADVVVFPENTGGAGGFAAGIERALNRHGADLVWLMDDDTVPEPEALAELLRVRDASAREAVVLASRVVWTDGRPHPMNMPRVHPFATARSRAAAAAYASYPIRSASFVSILVDAAVVRTVGLPIADYFLWNDDFEFTARMLRGRRGYLCERSVVVHKTRVFGSTDADPGPRFALEVRNKIWLMRLSRGLGPLERVVYGGSTLRRWVRTYLRSNDRATLSRGLRAGMRQGLGGRPRATASVLARVPDVATGAAAIDEAAGLRT